MKSKEPLYFAIYLRAFADRCMIEPWTQYDFKHPTIALDEPSHAESTPYCISNTFGLPICGKVAASTLPYLKLKHCKTGEVCGRCRREAIRIESARRESLKKIP